MIKILSVLITVISTYFIAKYNSNTPRKLEIKQKQLDKVYLPIYKLLLPHIGCDISKETALDLANNLKIIIWDNYEFAHPLLPILINKFISDIELNDDYQKTFDQICYHVSIDYDLLKKSLGYPCETVLGLFVRMKTHDKIQSILAWVNLILMISPVILALLSFNQYINRHFLRLVGTTYSILFIILLIEMWLNRIPDILKFKKK